MPGPEVESLQPPMPPYAGSFWRSKTDSVLATWKGQLQRKVPPGDFAWAKMNGKYNLSWAMNMGLSQFGMVAQGFSDLIHLDDWTLCGLDASISSSANGFLQVSND